MTSVIVGTNKSNNKSSVIAKFIAQQIDPCVLLDLSEMPTEFIHSDMYGNQHPSLKEYQDKYWLEPDRIYIVMPEYNGTFPGFLKLVIDAFSVREYSKSFSGKKLCLVGIGSGRGGNLRGLDHLTTAMNYLGCFVYPNRMAISKIDSVIQNGEIAVPEVKKDLSALVEKFQKF